MTDPVMEWAHNHIEGLRHGADNNWIGFCPLHGEEPGKSKPSFSFNSATGQWYCFSEGRGGGLPTLLKELGSSRDATDITMARLKPHLVEVARKVSPLKRKGLFKTQFPLPERILGLFENCPNDLLASGFTEEVLYRHDVGFDQERERITYPLRDIEGTLAGIVGKTNIPGQKYKVYRSELREMGFTDYSVENHDYLWRWDIVYPAVFAADARPTIFVAEGFKACLWLVQNGYENTVALMGTTMSPTQQLFLERPGGTVVWCLDNDEPGRDGTVKNGYRLKGLDQLILNYPTKNVRQPDDFDPTALHEAINESLTMREFLAKRRRGE